MLIGKRVLQDARNAHERFLLFFSNRGESDTSLVTAQRVQLFLNHVASTAESEAERKGKVCKGTAAQAVYKQLRALGFVLGSSLEPFDDHMLKVSLRTPRSGVAPPAHSSTLSVAAQIHFEHVAATHSRPMVRHAAACFAAMGITSLRGTDFSQVSILAGPGMDGAPSRSPVHLRAAKVKGSTRAQMPSLDIYCAPEGCLPCGSGWWFTLCSECGGRPCLLPGFVGASILEATAWKETPLPISSWRSVAAAILSLPPLLYTEQMLTDSGFDLHSPHSFSHASLAPLLAERAGTVSSLCSSSSSLNVGRRLVSMPPARRPTSPSSSRR
jgi:hypothetical protein